MKMLLPQICNVISKQDLLSFLYTPHMEGMYPLQIVLALMPETFSHPVHQSSGTDTVFFPRSTCY